MVALSTNRRAAMTRAARIPDDRAVVGCALSALVALLLMLLAGTAKAEESHLVCWDLPDGGRECDAFASVAATCEAIGYKHELCEVAQGDRSGTPLYFPGNTKYTAVKMTRAGLEKWHRYKPHVN